MKKKYFTQWIAALVLALGCQVAIAAAGDADTPTDIKGAKIVSVDEAKGMISSAKFFDVRSALNFGKGHIPGAVQVSGKWKSENTPNADISQDELDLSKLPGDKDAKLVIYSDGVKGWKSYKAAMIVAKAGYKNVLWMRNGFAEWESKGHPVEK